jgi:alkanesulfonate monooxygenase SsuD/methylene tetrahydromethanopterin reductase-like flavin-dependent oxidoreductase (luciferase family)
MEIGIDCFATILPDPATGRTPLPVDRNAQLLDKVETADRVGLDMFGTGEHHSAEFLDSAPAVLLATAAARTQDIRLTGAITG